MLKRHEGVEHSYNTRVWVESQQHPVIVMDVDNLTAVQAIVTKSALGKLATMESVLKRTDLEKDRGVD